jgi:hypothetical protein
MDKKSLENIISVVIKTMIQRVKSAVRRSRAQVFIAINSNGKCEIVDKSSSGPIEFLL